MATLGNLYDNNFGHHLPQTCQVRDRPRIVSMPIVLPEVQQPIANEDQQFPQQQYRLTPTPSTKNSESEQLPYRTHENEVDDCTTADDVTYRSSERTPEDNGPPPRSDDLKRKSPLREAARSLRTSKVAKRLRRQIKADIDPEDGDDAGASASESDHTGDPAYGSRTCLIQPDRMQLQRRPSVVSNLVNGLQSSLAIRTHGRGRGSSSASQTSSRMMDSSDSASTRTSFTASSSISKRSRNTEDEDPEWNDNDDGDRTGKRPCPLITPEPEQPQLYACPFAKYDPKRYSAVNLEELNYRGCSQSYLTDLARVKQHLYRVHVRPSHYCPTCFEVFKSQAYCIKHVGSRSCSPRPCPFDEKMSPEQLATVKKKNRGMDLYLGWYEIYKTLFPGAHPPMSPYAAFTATVDDLETFMDFMMLEIPARLKHQLGYGNPLIDVVQGSLPDILRDIRREFNPVAQQRLNVTAHDAADGTLQDTDERETSLDLNFHEMVTLAPCHRNQTPIGRPPVIELPPNTYGFTTAQSIPIISHHLSSQSPFLDQDAQEGVSAHYTHNQPYNYTIQDQNMMQGVDAGPLTALYRPDECESQHGYFVDCHQTQDTLPAYSIHFESEGNWLPNMVTTVADHPISMPGAHSVMGGLYQGGFNTHHG